MPIWTDDTVEKKLTELEKTTAQLLQKFKTQRTQRFQEFRVSRAAKSIRNCPLAKGEAWFQEEWHRQGMYIESDLFNHALGPYVPDCVNHKFKYVIEIDGKIHNQRSILVRDIKRAIFFKRKGYRVFFIRDFDDAKLSQVITKIKLLRKNVNWKAKPKYTSERFKFLNNA